MKANNLSICIPNKKCDKNCPYCISKMTGQGAEENQEIFYSNLQKAKRMAELCGVTSIIVTGKGEPLLDMGSLLKIGEVFGKDFPLEVQTNGVRLSQFNVRNNLKELQKFGYNTIAISIDSPLQMNNMMYLTKAIKKLNLGFTIRFTINLTNEMLQRIKYCSIQQTGERAINYFLKELGSKEKEFGVDQVSFREITIPNRPLDNEESKEAVEWINNNVDLESIKIFKKDLNSLISRSGVFVRKLPFGASIYMINGISVTHFDYCIQESSYDEDIRSLIYWEDGHMSSSWYGSNYGRIF